MSFIEDGYQDLRDLWLLERIERLERFERSVTLNDLNEAKCLNRLNVEDLVHRRSAQLSSVTRLRVTGQGYGSSLELCSYFYFRSLR